MQSKICIFIFSVNMNWQTKPKVLSPIQVMGWMEMVFVLNCFVCSTLAWGANGLDSDGRFCHFLQEQLSATRQNISDGSTLKLI